MVNTETNLNNKTRAKHTMNYVYFYNCLISKYLNTYIQVIQTDI